MVREGILVATLRGAREPKVIKLTYDKDSKCVPCEGEMRDTYRHRKGMLIQHAARGEEIEHTRTSEVSTLATALSLERFDRNKQQHST